MKYLLLILVLMSFNTIQAAKGLVIHGAEIGVGKFHRYDNTVHPYGAANAWTPYILPQEADHKTPVVLENADHSVTVFYSTLEELLQKIVEISKERGEVVSVLNLNGHGLPGGMWFPATESIKKGFECWQWNAAAAGADKANYDQYYTPVKKSDIMQIRQFSQTGGNVGCVTGLSQWKAVLSQQSTVKKSFAKNLKLNFLSCVVGLGPVGDKFVRGLGALLTDAEGMELRSSLNFGLGDWSMPEGMGFWDYLNDEQLNHDNSIYGVNRQDREIMQKGSVRVSTLTKGSWQSAVLEGEEFMSLERSELDLSRVVFSEEEVDPLAVKPESIRISGTGVYERVK